MKYKNLFILLLITTLINAAIPTTTNNIKLNIQKNNFDKNLTKLCMSLKCKLNIESSTSKYLGENKH